MKRCYVCKKLKEDSEFHHHKGRKDGLQNKCKDCSSKLSKARYKANSKAHYNLVKQLRVKRKAWFENYKKNLKCLICKETHSACLDFHHRNPSEKDLEVSVMIANSHSIISILKEIEKCDVLCSNCHRKLHYKQMGL